MTRSTSDSNVGSCVHPGPWKSASISTCGTSRIVLSRRASVLLPAPLTPATAIRAGRAGSGSVADSTAESYELGTVSGRLLRMAGEQPCEIVPGDRPGTFVLRLDGMSQSHVDLAHPTRLEFEYVRRIGDVLDVAEAPGAPLRVVHVGGAAMTLPRYVAATRPRSAQVVLEPAAEITELVHTELPLPPRSGIKVRDVDGRTGIAALRDEYAQVVVLDAFA